MVIRSEKLRCRGLEWMTCTRCFNVLAVSVVREEDKGTPVIGPPHVRLAFTSCCQVTSFVPPCSSLCLPLPSPHPWQPTPVLPGSVWTAGRSASLEVDFLGTPLSTNEVSALRYTANIIIVSITPHSMVFSLFFHSNYF